MIDYNYNCCRKKKSASRDGRDRCIYSKQRMNVEEKEICSTKNIKVKVKQRSVANFYSEKKMLNKEPILKKEKHSKHRINSK